jgi:hypothetical protein
MRTLLEILEAAQVGEPTTHKECLYALLAYHGLACFDSNALHQLAFHPSRFRTPERLADESVMRWKMAVAKSPKDWLGPSYDPANEECRERVKASRRLLEQVIAQTRPSVKE